MALSTIDSLPGGTASQRLQCLFGLLVFFLLALLVGRLRGARQIPWRVVTWGLVLQFAFGAIVLFAPQFLERVQFAVDRLLQYTLDGARMVFGNLVDTSVPAKVTSGDGSTFSGVAETGFIFATRVLPTIVFIATLTAVLYHLGILTWVVKGLAWLMQRTMGTSGAETLSTAANIFVGQTEAPLLVKPFLAAATRSELMAIMVGGFANIATGVLVAYNEMLREFVHQPAGHLAAACFISAPATLLVAKLMIPETETSATADTTHVGVETLDANTLDAAARGTSEGLALALNVGAMLVAFTALIALVNALIGGVGGWFGAPRVTLQSLLGVVLAPVAWLCGVSWSEAQTVGSLLGVKTVLNEFLAYLQMSALLRENPHLLSPRSALLTTYALAGFANFASVGIQIGGISTMAPSRRGDLSRLGLLAMVGGAIATCMTACVIGVLL